MASNKVKNQVKEIINKKAAYEFKFISNLEVGIILQGTEIKSIRGGFAGIREAYCRIEKGELYILNMYVKEYAFGNYNNHEPRRKRKLLLKKAELKRLDAKVKEKGYTIIPYKLYINERGYAKLEIALAQGKKTYDKRHVIKARENKRTLERIKKIR